MELKFAKLGKDYVVADYATLPDASKAYLANYGFQQSMQDCIAGTAKATAADLAEEHKKAGKPAPTNDEIVAATAAAIEGQLGKRLDAIIEGTIGVRTVAQRDPLLAIAREMVWDSLRKPENSAAKKAINAMDKEPRAAKLAELSAKVLEKHRVAIEAEHQRRQATSTAIVVELD